MVNDWKKEIFTIPNLLSLFRILLIPVYVTIYLNAEELKDYILAAGVLALSCITDFLDGRIARRCNMISTVGKILDPIADKATQLTLTFCLALRYPILNTVLMLLVIKEGFQLIVGIIHLRLGKMLTGALMAGKVCTTVLFVSLIVMVLCPGMSQTLVNLIAVVDSIFLLYSFISYIRAYYGKNIQVEDIHLKKK